LDFEGKIFPCKQVLHVNLGWHPSYAWRSIIKARAVLEEGLVWRVGNGENTRI